jgi:hypothetical protein
MEEAGDEPLFCERAAGIDIGKQVVSVTIRVPGDTRRGGRQQETREFGTTRRQLLEMADGLRCWQVERAGMEATRGLLEAGVLLAGAGGPGLPALPGVAGQGAARAAEDRPVNRTPWHSHRSQARLIVSLKLLTCPGRSPQGHKGMGAGRATTVSGHTVPIPSICFLLAAACHPGPGTDLSPSGGP